MFLLTKPSREQIAQFVAAQAGSKFSYNSLGATVEGSAPSGYRLDHNRICLGHGEATWLRAIEAIRGWHMFEMPWMQLCWPNAQIEVGTNVAVLIKHFGFWSLNPCRIVRVIQEIAPERFGFAYGTLGDHSESGEERFLVEWSQDDDSIWYDLMAFSRPRAALARFASPLARMLQRRFVVCSQSAMLKAVA